MQNKIRESLKSYKQAMKIDESSVKALMGILFIFYFLIGMQISL